MTALRTLDLTRPTADRLDELLDRSVVPDAGIRAAAAEICESIRVGGDAAVLDISQRVGGGFRRVATEELDTATDHLDPRTRTALEASIGAVERYHAVQLPTDSLRLCNGSTT